MPYKNTEIPSIQVRLFSCFALVFFLVSCDQMQIPPAPSFTTQPSLPPATSTPAQSAYWEDWEISPHANTYALEKGPNTYCARCHSPKNWDPEAKIDPPPNCVSCKFPFETEARIAQSNPLVPQDEWMDIGCEICHQVKNGVASAELYWLDIKTGYHETVQTSTELCEKCHTDTETIRHKRDVDGGAHTDFLCTNCHDPHTTVVDYGAEQCHSDVEALRVLPSQYHADMHADINDQNLCLQCHPEGKKLHKMETTYNWVDDCLNCHTVMHEEEFADAAAIEHSKIHNSVNCVACHDASNLEVAPIEGYGEWITFRTTELLGRSHTIPYQSHNLQKDVDCNLLCYSFFRMA